MTRAAWAAFLVCMAIALYFYDDRAYGAASLASGLGRLALLLIWAWVSGYLMDAAHGVSFKEDREHIVGGNLAVALSRSIGHAVIFLPGAMLIAKI